VNSNNKTTTNTVSVCTQVPRFTIHLDRFVLCDFRIVAAILQVTGGVHTLPRRRVGASHMSNDRRGAFYDKHKDTLYMCRSICVLTRLPIVPACETLLR
jgi:hypothetical protein